MNQEVINTLEYRAREIADKFLKHLPGSTWNGFAWDEVFHIGHPAKDKIIFRRLGNRNGTAIIFSDIAPHKIIDKTVGEPLLLGDNIIDVQSSVVRNESHSVSLDRSYELDIDESSNAKEKVGVAVGLGIHQKLTAGGDVYGFKYEAEIKLDIETSYEKETGTSTNVGRTSKNSITVPPMTEATLITKRSTKKFEQTVDFTAEITHGVEIIGGGNHNYSWDTLSQLDRAMKGEASDDIDKGNDWRLMPFNEYHRSLIIDNSPVLEFSTTIEFEKSIAGDVVLTTTSI